MIYVLTLWNKPEYIEEARKSVYFQSLNINNYNYICVKDEGQFAGRYPPAAFYNEQVKAMQPEDMVIWLSDDDLLTPNALKDMSEALIAHPEWNCVWGWSQHIIVKQDHSIQHVRYLPQDCNFQQIFNAGNLPMFKIDGGQYMARRKAFDKVDYPYVPEFIGPECRISDGFVMNKIASAVSMFPINVQVCYSRTTPLSSHVRSTASGGLVRADWITGKTDEEIHV